jgi:peptidyl-prolyl cis-trans isomerase B (cyclophilin B)
MRSTTLLAAAMGAMAAAGAATTASAQLTPDRLYYGVNRPIPMSVAAPEGADGEVEIRLLAPESAEVIETASAEVGRVDLSTLFPILWTRQSPTLLYAQLVVGGEKIGPAVVLQPLLTPRQANASGRSVTFTPDMGRVNSGLRAYTDRHVVFDTSHGEITVALRPDQAPNTCMNFIHLVEGGFYTDIAAHRILPAFVVQFGDPTGSGGGGPGYNFDLEPSQMPHDFGVLSMARTADPDTNGSQVFLCLTRARTQALDGAYTAFGVMVGGADALMGMASTPLADPRAGTPETPPVIRGARTVPAPPYGEGPSPVTRPAPGPSER